MAFSWMAESAVPYVMGLGVAHVIGGVARLTTICTDWVTVLQSLVSVGLKVTEKVSVPAARILSNAGV
jgi:hypothetical protein